MLFTFGNPRLGDKPKLLSEFSSICKPNASRDFRLSFMLQGLFHLTTGRCGDVCLCRRIKEHAYSCPITSLVTLLDVYKVISPKEGVVEKERRSC